MDGIRPPSIAIRTLLLGLVNHQSSQKTLVKHDSITVIYDGECRFCQASINWLALKLKFTAIPFQSADLATFNLTREECAKEVITILDSTMYRGATAVAALLRVRGDRLLATIILKSGIIGRASYRWVATHRSSPLVRLATYLLERAVAKKCNLHP
jgi:predicted DCC family thiol-disulfide oxidoreductase YuxK